MNEYKKISELDSIVWTELSQDDDLIPVVDRSASLTKKISVSELIGVCSVQVYIVEAETACEVKEGAYYFRVPKKLDGRKLIEVAACCITAGVTGTMTMQIRNINISQNLLSTVLRIDSTEKDSKDASVQPVINTLYNTVSEGDQLRIDILTIHTTPANGLIFDMSFL